MTTIPAIVLTVGVLVAFSAVLSAIFFKSQLAFNALVIIFVLWVLIAGVSDQPTIASQWYAIFLIACVAFATNVAAVIAIQRHLNSDTPADAEGEQTPSITFIPLEILKIVGVLTGIAAYFGLPFALEPLILAIAVTVGTAVILNPIAAAVDPTLLKDGRPATFAASLLVAILTKDVIASVVF